MRDKELNKLFTSEINITKAYKINNSTNSATKRIYLHSIDIQLLYIKAPTMYTRLG